MILHCCWILHFYLSVDAEVAKAQESSRFKFLPNKCTELFTHAKVVLDNVCARITAGTITPRELLLMKDNKIHVSRLIAANFLEKEEVKCVQRNLEQRFHEYAEFLERKERLGLLCQHIDVPVKGRQAYREV